MSRHDFEKLLLEAVDAGLSSLGDSSKHAIYFHLDENFSIKKEQIPSRINDFAGAIENIFGIGANYLEILIMKRLYEKVGGTLEWDDSARLAFTNYVAAAKRVFQEKEKARTKEGLIECETTAVEV